MEIQELVDQDNQAKCNQKQEIKRTFDVKV
jgi:hypothetical protein